MAIIEKLEPKQAASCDLCGSQFDLSPKKNYMSFAGGIWEDASITIYPNVGLDEDSYWKSKGNIRVEHACENCRNKFTDEVRLLLEKLKTI